MNFKIEFRLAIQDDALKIVEIHKKAFKKDHFSALFPDKMLKEYFKLLLKLNHFSVVVYNGENLLGYIIAGNNIRVALETFIKKNRVKIVLILLSHPKFLYEKIKEVLSETFGIKRKSLYPLRLFLIAINPEHKKNGFGVKLLSFFEDRLKENKIFNYGLSVRKKNKRAITFYERNGFVSESV